MWRHINFKTGLKAPNLLTQKLNKYPDDFRDNQTPKTQNK